ncbi:hypothetical protein KQI38_00730 [Tissierella carlieri]|uniref:hypothetical protein n=1 Tax=Tissierella carlieri TaxID=689904 RepID=UPI001C122206|nr:hypothetical protein [Tissierella carlieri]MBU5310537.1 hypothetical protein [Tissierella carlieri]
MVEVRALPNLSSLLMSYISLLSLIVIMALGVYMFVKVLSAIRDIRKIREGMDRIIENLENKD